MKVVLLSFVILIHTELVNANTYALDNLNDVESFEIDSLMHDTLQAVVITSSKSVTLPSISNTLINEGKKTEMLYLQNLDGNTATNNSRQIFSKIPGIHIWESDGSGIQVGIAARGLSPNRSWEFNVRQNGYDVTPDIFGYSEAYYNPPMEAVDHVEIVRGAASLQYGPQFGGLVNYILKSAPKDDVFSFETQNTTGNNKLFSSYNSIGGTIKKFSYFGSYDIRRSDGWRANSQYLTQHSFLKMEYQFNKKIQIAAEATYSGYKSQQPGGLTDSLFQLNQKQSLRSRNWFSAPWWLWNVSLKYQPKENLQFQLKVYGIKGNRNSVGFLSSINIPDTIMASSLQYANRVVDKDAYKNVGFEWRGLYQYKLFKQEHALSFGVRYYYAHTLRQQQGKGTTGADADFSILTDSFPRQLNFTTHNASFYVENIWHIRKNLSITPGIRYEYIYSNIGGRYAITAGNPINLTQKNRQRHIALAGVAIEYKPTKNTALYANIAQAFRPVGYGDITPPGTMDSIDTELKDSKGYNVDIGYRGSIRDFLSFDVGVFYLNYKNRIGTVRRFINEDSTKSTYQLRTNIGASRSVGVEAYIEFNPVKLATDNLKYGHVSIFTSIGFTDARYKDFVVTSVTGTAPSIRLTTTNLKNKLVENAPKHTYRTGLQYQLDRNDKKGNAHYFSSTLQWSYTGVVFTDALNTELPNAIASIGKINGYHLLDWSMTYKYMKRYIFKGGVNNLSNTRYATRRAGGYPGPGLLPADGLNWFISVGVKI